jgi:hypothetical protein
VADFVAKVGKEIGGSRGGGFLIVVAAHSCRSLRSERRL